MQSRVEMQEPVSGQRLQIHIGLQFGSVLEEGQDVFGDCVNVAARMVKLAKPSQIIAGGECVEALSKPMRDQTRALDKLPVKGREQEVDVYEVLWRHSEELTYMASRAPGPPKTASSAAVPEARREGNDPGPRARPDKAGRENSCDIIIADRKALASNARIERRREQVSFWSMSVPTALLSRFTGGPEMAVKREEVVLHGRGSISFGHPYSSDPTEVAAFEVETPT